MTVRNRTKRTFLFFLGIFFVFVSSNAFALSECEKIVPFSVQQNALSGTYEAGRALDFEIADRNAYGIAYRMVECSGFGGLTIGKPKNFLSPLEGASASGIRHVFPLMKGTEYSGVLLVFGDEAGAFTHVLNTGDGSRVMMWTAEDEKVIVSIVPATFAGKSCIVVGDAKAFSAIDTLLERGYGCRFGTIRSEFRKLTDELSVVSGDAVKYAEAYNRILDHISDVTFDKTLWKGASECPTPVKDAEGMSPEQVFTKTVIHSAFVAMKRDMTESLRKIVYENAQTSLSKLSDATLLKLALESGAEVKTDKGNGIKIPAVDLISETVDLSSLKWEIVKKAVSTEEREGKLDVFDAFVSAIFHAVGKSGMRSVVSGDVDQNKQFDLDIVLTVRSPFEYGLFFNVGRQNNSSLSITQKAKPKSVPEK